MFHELRMASRYYWAQLRRGLRAAHALAKSPALPKWLKVLLVIGCIQVPVLPFDEIALAAALIILALRYRPVLAAAWVEAAR